MTEPIQPDSAPEQDNIPMASRVKFCPQCGNPRSDPVAPCVHCERAAPYQYNPQEHGNKQSQIRQVISIYSCMLGSSVVFLIAAVAMSGNASALNFEIFTSSVFSIVISCFALYHFRTLLGLTFHAFNPVWLLAAIPIAACTSLGASLLVSLLQKFGVENIQYLATFEESAHPAFWAILLVCVQPAIFEELAFRGVIQSCLTKILTNFEAILVSGFMFAILHLTLVSFPHLAILGIILGWLRAKTGSLLPGILLHFLHNLFVLGLEKYGGF